MTPSRHIDRLLQIMAALRTPETGCPWDLAQDFSTIAPYTLEEAYEVADAIARGDLLDLKEELGDLLLQVAFHARMAEEAGAFDFGDVVSAITEKLIRRHPHVFGAEGSQTAQAVEGLWERIKAPFGRWREFLHEVRVEMRQVTWPTRHEVFVTTWVVPSAVPPNWTTRSAIVSTWSSISVRNPSSISCTAMNSLPRKFQCACLVTRARSMQSATRAFNRSMDTDLALDATSFRV